MTDSAKEQLLPGGDVEDLAADAGALDELDRSQGLLLLDAAGSDLEPGRRGL